jgi:hypothetical protein
MATTTSRMGSFYDQQLAASQLAAPDHALLNKEALWPMART